MATQGARARAHTYVHTDARTHRRRATCVCPSACVCMCVSRLQLLAGAEHTAFGDGDACRSNGCAPPGPTTTRPAASSGHGIGVEPPLVGQTARLKAGGSAKRGGHKSRSPAFGIPPPSLAAFIRRTDRCWILRSRIFALPSCVPTHACAR